MKQRLPAELLQHLKIKAVSILTYYQPERGKPIATAEPWFDNDGVFSEL